MSLFNLLPTSQTHHWLIAADWLEEEGLEITASAFREDVFVLEIVNIEINGYGNGIGNGRGCEYGIGNGRGWGNGFGECSGSGWANGFGDGDGRGIGDR